MLGTRYMRTLILLAAMTAVFAIVVGACGGDDDATPAPSGITADEIRQIVSEEVAQAQPAAPAAAPEFDMQAIQALIAGAVEQATADGVSADQIEALVTSAVADAAGDAVSTEDVQSAISQAVMEAQANMITSADVRAAIQQATAGGLDADDVRGIMAEGAQDALTEAQVAAIVAQALEDQENAMMMSREEIIFSDLNWTSAQVQNRIAQYIVELGYGYPTSAVFGATLPLFNGLRNGDTHVTMEIWLPNQDEAWAEAQSMGQVVAVGESLGKDWQSAFVIPAYLQEQYPELDSVEDLMDDQYKALFATTETDGKARLVSCVIGWACEGVNASQITGYGLDDHVHIVNPGDGAAGNADLYGAYDKGEPWLGYQWGTNDPALLLDLVRLEEPPYSDECWFTTKACAYEDATILIAVGPEMLTRAPEVVSMLRNWTFDIAQYKTVAAWSDENQGATANDGALWWLQGNEDVWRTWMSTDAAAAVRAALDAGTTPDGWPES